MNQRNPRQVHVESLKSTIKVISDCYFSYFFMKTCCRNSLEVSHSDS